MYAIVCMRAAWIFLRVHTLNGQIRASTTPLSLRFARAGNKSLELFRLRETNKTKLYEHEVTWIQSPVKKSVLKLTLDDYYAHAPGYCSCMCVCVSVPV